MRFQFPWKKTEIRLESHLPEWLEGLRIYFDWKEAISALSQILVGGGMRSELSKTILDSSMQE
jgi:hypothetical protein